MKGKSWLIFAAGVTGCVSGILGAGGGMVLLPMLQKSGAFKEEEIFPLCVGVIGPICGVSLLFSSFYTALPLMEALPYCLGSLPGGILAGRWGDRIPLPWLHLILGAFMLWGGVRSLWG